MTYNILQNLHRKTYRHETIVIEQKNSFYTTQKSFARQIEIYYLGKAKEEYRFQVLVVDFDFSDDEDAMGKFLKRSVIYLMKSNAKWMKMGILQPLTICFSFV